VKMMKRLGLKGGGETGGKRSTEKQKRESARQDHKSIGKIKRGGRAQ